MLDDYSVVIGPFKDLVVYYNVNLCRSTLSYFLRSFHLLHECRCLSTARPFALPIVQIKTNIKAVRGFYLAIQYTCLSTHVIPDDPYSPHYVYTYLCLSLNLDIIATHAPMISGYKQFDPLCLLVSMPISPHYPGLVTARTYGGALAFEYKEVLY